MQRLREKFQQVRSVLLLGIPSARKQHIAHFLYRSATCTLKIPFCREILADILARILLFCHSILESYEFATEKRTVLFAFQQSV